LKVNFDETKEVYEENIEKDCVEKETGAKETK